MTMEVPGKVSDCSFKKETDLDDIYCQPCRSEDEWETAVGYCQNCSEYLCATCLKVHRKQSATKNHLILKDEEMPRSLSSASQLEPCSDVCFRHRNEIIKFYCRNHDLVGCCDCMVLEHKACTVDRIQDISGAYFKGTEHIMLQDNISQIEEGIEHLRKEATDDLTENQQQCSNVNQNIAALRVALKAFLNEQEAKLRDEIGMISQENETKIKQRSTYVAEIEAELRTVRGCIDVGPSEANILFVNAKTLKEKIMDMIEKIQALQRKNQVKKIKFSPSADVTRLLSSNARLGQVIEEVPGVVPSVESMPEKMNASRKQTNRPDFDDEKEKIHKSSECEKTGSAGKTESLLPLTTEPKFVKNLPIKTSKDKKDCCVLAFAALSSGKLILADKENFCVKLVDSESGNVLGRYQFQCAPVGIAVINSDSVAVSLAKHQVIQELEISHSNTFKTGLKWEVGINASHLAFKEKMFAVAFELPARVDLVSEGRTKMSTIEIKEFNTISGLAFCPSSDALFVSVWKAHLNSALLKYSLDGQKLATCTFNMDPRGFTVTQNSSILVCNWKSKGSVNVLSSELEHQKQLLKENENIRYPYSVAMCSTTELYLYCYHGVDLGSQWKNNIKVFRFRSSPNASD